MPFIPPPYAFTYLSVFINIVVILSIIYVIYYNNKIFLKYALCLVGKIWRLTWT